MSTDYAIEIENLSYSYKSDWTARKFQALKSISVAVRRGEAFGFLGHNGAGKTTTIKCLLGLIKPSAGKILLFGKSHYRTEARRSVGYLPEQPYFYDHLTVVELMTMYGHLAGVESSVLQQEVQNALNKVAVSAKSKSPMRALSKGLTQRVAMAQALLGSPELLVLDEPFSGLDPIGRKHFKDLLFDLKAEGKTIFVSSHILGDIEFLCDRASIMSHGEIKKVFSLRELPSYTSASCELILRQFTSVQEELEQLCDRSEVQDKFLRVSFDEHEKAEQALRLVLDSDAVIDSYTTKQGSLEDLFVKLVQFEEAKEQ